MKDLDASKLLRIVEWRKRHRPLAWIAREEGIPQVDVRTILRLCGETVVGTEISAERWDEINYWVIQDVSLETIRNETGADPRQVRKYFPRAGWEAGGAGRAAEARQMYQGLARIDGTGKLTKRRQRT